MSGERDLVIGLAHPGDAAELAAVYAGDEGFPGDIGMRFLRSPDPLASLQAEGERVVLPVMREGAGGPVVGLGACVIRRSWVGGAERTVGYLTGLKVVPGYRRGPVAMRRAYAFMREQAPEVDVFITTILDDNAPAIRLLERGHRGMPEYRLAGHVSTFAFRRAWPTPVRPAPLGTPRARRGLSGGTVAELLEPRGVDARRDLALAAAPMGITDADVRVLRDRGGEMLAGCAIWDQSAGKQYVVTGYGGAYALLSRLPVHLLGYPRFPRPGTPARDAAISLVWVRGGDPALLGELLRGVAWAERERDFVRIAGVDGGLVTQAMRGLRAVRYGSRLYTVHYPDSPDLGLGPDPDLEVALL